MSRHWRFFALGGSLALGLALRLAGLSAEPFLGDEVLSLDIATHFGSAGEMLQYLREVEFHPPLYYLLLRAWTAWFGASEFVVRLPSVIFGLATIILTYFAGRRMFQSRNTGLLAAFFVTILPMQILYSRMARPYVIFCFFGLAALWCYVEYWRSRKAWWLAGYAVANLIALYLHYSAGFALAALALWWLARTRTSAEFVRWLVVHAAIALGFAWWLPAIFYKLILGRIEIFGLVSTWILPRRPDFFLASLQRLVWTNHTQLVNPLLAVLEIAALFGLGVLIARRGRELFFWLWLIFFPILLFLVSPFSVPYTFITEQHLLFLTIPFAFLVATVILGLRRNPAVIWGVFFVITLLPFIVESATNSDGSPMASYQTGPVGRYISEHYLPGDMVLVSDAYVRTDLNHYLPPESAAVSLYPLTYWGLDFWNSRQTLGFVENEYQRRVTPVDKAPLQKKLDVLVGRQNPRRVWLAFFNRNDYGVYAWFGSRGARHGFQSEGDLFPLDLYILPK